MAGQRKITDETYEKIVTQKQVFQKTSEKISEELGVSRNTVDTVCYAFTDVRDENWEHAASLLTNQSIPFSLFQWAADRLGKELPPMLEEAYQKGRERIAERRKGWKGGDTAKEEAPAPAPVPDHWAEEKLLLGLILAELKKNNELFEQLYDVVFPKWAGDVKDNVNVNNDLVNQTLKRIEDKLEAIKIGVRRKGM